jgi:hypothetical protein
METKEYSVADARAYILDGFRKQGDFVQIMDEKALEEMVDAVMALDAAFIQQTGADGDAFYDEDAAFEYLQKNMAEKFTAYKMYIMRFVGDYMDYNDSYLESAGLIEWD